MHTPRAHLRFYLLLMRGTHAELYTLRVGRLGKQVNGLADGRAARNRLAVDRCQHVVLHHASLSTQVK